MDRAHQYSIAQACRELDLSPRTVRYYEELGLLPGVRRKNGRQRVYGADELERLRFIQRLKQLGLSLQEISELNAVYAIQGSTRAMLEKLRELLHQHLDVLDAKVRDLRALQAEMRSYLDHISRRVDEPASQKEKSRANGRS